LPHSRRRTPRPRQQLQRVPTYGTGPGRSQNSRRHRRPLPPREIRLGNCALQFLPAAGFRWVVPIRPARRTPFLL